MPFPIRSIKCRQMIPAMQSHLLVQFLQSFFLHSMEEFLFWQYYFLVPMCYPGFVPFYLLHRFHKNLRKSYPVLHHALTFCSYSHICASRFVGNPRFEICFVFLSNRYTDKLLTASQWHYLYECSYKFSFLLRFAIAYSFTEIISIHSACYRKITHLS